jgi:hypothetical protein
VVPTRDIQLDIREYIVELVDDRDCSINCAFSKKDRCFAIKET